MILNEINKQVIEIARTAAQNILTVYNSDFTVDNKDDNSPLTQADLVSHQVIIAGLTTLTPEIPVLSEESSALTWEERKQWQRYWLIDPLDGTKEFVKRNGEFTVNIALIDNHLPILGVVYVPVTDVCYYASQSDGAYKIAEGITSSIKTRKTDTGQITISGSRSHANNKQQAFINALGEQTDIISIGSSLKFCLVAEGSVDIYPRFGPTSEWDTAAAHCIVSEAGGTVVDMNYQPLRYNEKESLLNPEFIVIGDTEFDWQPYLNQI